jgi:hypothetical protein
LHEMRIACIELTSTAIATQPVKAAGEQKDG